MSARQNAETAREIRQGGPEIQHHAGAIEQEPAQAIPSRQIGGDRRAQSFMR